MQTGGPTEHQALRVATIMGAEAIGFGGDLGSSEVDGAGGAGAEHGGRDTPVGGPYREVPEGPWAGPGPSDIVRSWQGVETLKKIHAPCILHVWQQRPFP